MYYFGSMDSLEPSFPFNLLGFPGGLMPIGTIITVTGGTVVPMLGVLQKYWASRRKCIRFAWEAVSKSSRK